LCIAVLASAQEKAPEPAPAEPASPLPQANSPADPNQLPPLKPPSAYAVGDKPPAVEKVLSGRPKKVWSAILAALQEAQVPVETSDEQTGYLKTQLIHFDHTRFSGVATPPPQITLERPIRQFMGLNKGNFSIEVQVAKAKGGTSVSIQPYIEEHAFNVTEDRRLWVERYSNGTIEKYFFERFEKALK
jgi:hypothetical protein